MITVEQAQKLCQAKYIELWGSEWVRKRVDDITDGTLYPIKDNELSYEIVYVDAPKRPDGEIRIGGEGKPTHYTGFLVDLQTAKVQITEHY